MSNISTWSTTAGSNNSTSPDGFPENMAPSGVNNSARELMAAIRTQHENAQWIDRADTGLTYASASTFTITADVTAEYDVGRRVKCTDSTTLYGTITASAYSSVTTVTVSLDSGALSASLTAVALGILSGTNQSIPNSARAITVEDTTDSTSGTTGSIQTDGGIGAVGSIATDAGFIGDLTGTLATAAQPNVTSTGALTSLTVSGESQFVQVTETVVALSGVSPDVDLELGTVFTHTVATSTNTFTFSNETASMAGSFTLILTNGGSQTVNYPATVDWARGTAPTLTASGVDILTFIPPDGGTAWYGFLGGADFS